jgi:hypothetical protein
MSRPTTTASLILRGLDEIERKLNEVLDELRAPTAIGYSVRSSKRIKPSCSISRECCTTTFDPVSVARYERCGHDDDE